MELNEYCRIKWERARELRIRGRFREAEQELNEALEESPGSPLLRASLANLHLTQDRPVEARVIAETILLENPHYPQALYVLGQVYGREGRHEKALECFTRAAELDGGAYLTLRVATTLRKLERYGEALDTLDGILVREKDNARALKEKALILNRMERPGEALTLYERVQELDPEDSFVRKEIYRLRGLGREDEAVIRELKTVVGLSSRKDDAQLHGYLGKKLRDSGAVEEAAAEYHTAWTLAPRNVFFLKQEGFCHNKLGNRREAMESLEEAFLSDPDDFAVRSTLEKLYTSTGDSAGFAALVAKALERHPGNGKLMGILKRLEKEIDAKNRSPE